MKRAAVLTSLALGLSASSARANPDPTPPTDFASSDTMRELTILVINASGAPLTATGGGSSLAGQRMSPVNSSNCTDCAPDGNQQLAPQSRFMNATECNAVAAGRGQGIQIALDGLAVHTDATEGSSCRTLRYAGCMQVQDLNNAAVLGFGNGTAGLDDGTGQTALLNLVDGPDADTEANEYCFTHWADALRIIYNGQHAHLDDSSQAAACGSASASAIANKRCNSDVRRTLVENWANIFDTANDDGAGGCGDVHCTRLKHAFRRDDFSGTTDAFLSLIGAPGLGASFNVRSFCNGLENEDLDPIRRAATTAASASNDPETVAAPIPFANRNAPFGADGSPTGAAGTTAPTAPAANAVGDLGLVLPISLPQSLSLQYDNNFCTSSPFGGSFKYAPMPAALSQNAQRCPDGNGRTAGQCRYPVYASGPNAGRFNCKARRTNRPGAIAWTNFDARAYNLTPRDPVTGAILQPNSGTISDPRWGGGGHYRIHQAFPEPSQTATAFTAGAHPTCQLADATQQIGCLVQADPCSIGYAGLEASDRDANPADVAVLGTNRALFLRSPLDVDTAETVAGNDTELDPIAATDSDADGITDGDEFIQRVLEVSGSSCTAGNGDFDVRYPIARILWLNASKGFGPVGSAFPSALPNITNVVDSNDGDTLPDLTTGENDFAATYTNRAVVDPFVDQLGFIRLPAGYPEASRLRQCQ